MRTTDYVKKIVGTFALACACGRAVPAETLVLACETGRRLACTDCGATFQAPAIGASNAWLHVVDFGRRLLASGVSPAPRAGFLRGLCGAEVRDPRYAVGALDAMRGMAYDAWKEARDESYRQGD